MPVQVSDAGLLPGRPDRHDLASGMSLSARFPRELIARHLAGTDPLPGTSRDQLVPAVAPTVQRYFIGPLDDSWQPRSMATGPP